MCFVIVNLLYIFVVTTTFLTQWDCSWSLLFVQQNEYRQLYSLDGLWTFVREPSNSIGIGMLNNWAGMNLANFENSSLVPVPAAYNDLTADREQRDHVGWVWYQREYLWSDILRRDPSTRIFLRFGSVQYHAVVFLNGEKLTEHIGGHLPFEVELTSLKYFMNLITVAVNNTLSAETIPPGDFRVLELRSGRKLAQQVLGFDFFNYAGILRSVHLWFLPSIFISDIRIQTDSAGTFSYRIDIDYGINNGTDRAEIQAKVVIYTRKERKIIYEIFGLQNTSKIPGVDLWWPRGMGKPNLYIAEVTLYEIKNYTEIELDVYRETFGFRSVSFDQNRIYINGQPFYCHGFGMHEDFGIHGRGFDRVAMVKDLNMFEWLNANCYRTSHYPYNEERAYEADRRGIAVITEVPAVGIKYYNESHQILHARMITEMVMRDKNHPSVIMWSLANEPDMHPNNTHEYEYFKNLITLTRYLDATRPITVVFGYVSRQLEVASLLDVICVNAYHGWYREFGILEAIQDQLMEDVRKWRRNEKKPVILSEYGAEAIVGFNEEPSVTFSEQYQSELIQITGRSLDVLRNTDDIAGEMLWNFADFMTAQSINRVIGNHKGVLSRDRKPKLGAYTIQKRYKKLLYGLEFCLIEECHLPEGPPGPG